MAVVIMAGRQRNTSDSAEYGWFVRKMMAEHRFSSQQELANALRAAGHPISQPALSKIIGGKTEPSRKLHRTLVGAMELTPEETRQFNDIFALADINVAITEENREGMEEIDEEARRTAEEKADHAPERGEQSPTDRE